jgi:tRNA(adenine34) deaminase
VVFGAIDAKTGAAGSLLNLFADERLNHHTELLGEVLAPACGQLLRDFFAERRAQQRADKGAGGDGDGTDGDVVDGDDGGDDAEAAPAANEPIPTGEVFELGPPADPGPASR